MATGDGMDTSGMSSGSGPPGLNQQTTQMDQATLIAMIQAEFAENRKNVTTQVDRIQGNLNEAQKEYRQEGTTLKGEIAAMQKIIEDKFEKHKNKQDAIKLEDRQEREAMKGEILTTVRAELMRTQHTG